MAEHATWIYVAIPVISALVGWGTKLLMIEMMFRPQEFRGPVDPWLGWQGQIPRSATKVAVRTVQTLRDGLLDPGELLERVDVEQLLQDMADPLDELLRELVEEVARENFPAAWAATPIGVREVIVARARSQMPQIAARILEDTREHLDQLVDLEDIVVRALVSDTATLTRMFRGMGDDTFDFIKWSGLVFGFGLGVVQSLLLLVTGVELIVPLFGLLVGGLTDWIALQMVFRPVEPGRFLLIPWQGRFHRLRDEITRDYAQVIAQHVLTPRVVLHGVLTGPRSDRLFALVEREVRTAIDEQAPQMVRPLVHAAVGPERMGGIKDAAARRVADEIVANVDTAAAYTTRSLDLQGLIVERMDRMSDEQYEGLLRPIFKDQEWVVVVLGAALGFAIGEVQVQLLLH